MTAVTASRSRVLPALQMSVPMLAAGSFFVFSEGAADLNNPELPFAFRLGKDIAFAVLVLLPAVAALLSERMTVAIPMMLYLLMPLVLGLTMLLIGALKVDIGFVPAGIVRNVALYYAGGGAMVLLAAHRGQLLWLFRAFRFLMVVAVVTGLAFYVFADNLLLFTIHGRMIGTLGNPNFLGFLSLLWLVILHGWALPQGRVTRPQLVEFGLALVGLMAAASMAAILSYAVWLVCIAALAAFGALPPSRVLRRLLTAQLLVVPVVVVGIIAFIEATNPGVLEIVAKTQAILSGGSETTTIRLLAYLTVFADLAWSHVVFIGQTTQLRFVEFDGSNLSIIYNFGVPYFLLWSAFFLAPVFAAARAWPDLCRGHDALDTLTLMLVPFLAVSFAIEYWLQYVPEKYPTCLILAWIMYFVMYRSVLTHDRRSVTAGVAR